MGLPLAKALPLARVCGHYLNLTEVAELHHRYSAFLTEFRCNQSSYLKLGILLIVLKR